MNDTPTAASQHIFAPGLFRGQRVIVTGGGSGIGLASARAFARLGARVAICGRDEDKLAAARDELQAVADEARAAAAEADSEGEMVYAAPCDIRSAETVEGFVGAVRERFGGIDVLFNNAGGQFASPATGISPKGFAAVVRNNLEGTYYMTHAVATQAMIPQRGGCIVNMSANVYRGFPGMVHTGAARAGVENMTMTLAVEWASYGIRINAVAPGIILSSGTDQYPPAILSRALSQVPIARGGTVEEVAAAVVFLASPAAQYISGVSLRIDGGISLSGEMFPR
ncbi:SDR family oxidoreductase [Haliangium ochraceum]|uniref:Peroxisomal trans-2-enoyl-CoA reductase n=1 Tax=Haliangium ochraceum (strain DSM 14365 / JCM 11303 / SMP-2) TaxID=502025 RepID=D0LGU4_HALO1|nr:SDR family oxidoreductase [Haliangium ochraceum]ACY14666.1 short-chain dehydrogenase/reductase SDR [Haliangium ochraceum DSM 14365]